MWFLDCAAAGSAANAGAKRFSALSERNILILWLCASDFRMDAAP